MLTTKQITEILGCNKSAVPGRMLKLGIKKHTHSFAHGKKNSYAVTEEQLRELIAQQKTPE
ncbi:MAG: hypothetical protein JNL77_08840 [Nitrosomonas sp.]|nr:hypothetical protein [Nitrosomonas sp.]